jgi:hypothetical protein
MNSTARKRREDDSQMNVWEFVAPAPTGDLRADLVELMKVMARQRDLFGVTIGECVYKYEEETGRRVGGEPRATKQEEQRQTSWLARVPKIAGLKATGDFRRSPVKRHHGSLHRVYCWPSIRDVQR